MKGKWTSRVKWSMPMLIALAVSPSFGQGRDLEPAEPDIVLPQVVLEIDDLSVENVEAKLPPEEELLPPQREIPILAEGELPVGEPSIPSAAPGAEASAAVASHPLTTEAVVGAGLENTIVGRLGMKTLGTGPRFSLSFVHETVDGFAHTTAEGVIVNTPGSGFNSRDDSIGAELALKLGPVDSDLQGSFQESEDGLQGLSPYVSRLSRALNGGADFKASPLDWLTLSGSVHGGADFLTLTSPGTASGPFALSEYRVSPILRAEARFQPVRIGVSGEYGYRSMNFASGVDEIHRVHAWLTAAWEMPASMLLEGSAGWFWNSNAGSFFPFPFELSFSGTPLDFLTFGIGGGYRVSPFDAETMLSAYPLVLPQAIADDAGWFADSSLLLSFAKVFSLSGKLTFMASGAMPDSLGYPALVPDTATGFFLLTSRSALRLTSELGLRWNVVPSVSLSASWKREILDRPSFVPQDELTAEGIAIEQSGAFGGNFSVSLLTDLTPEIQLPVVDIGGFVKVSDSVQLHLDIKDLLQPALGEPRYTLYPYVAPGFRVIAMVQLSF